MPTSAHLEIAETLLHHDVPICIRVGRSPAYVPGPWAAPTPCAGLRGAGDNHRRCAQEPCIPITIPSILSKDRNFSWEEVECLGAPSVETRRQWY